MALRSEAAVTVPMTGPRSRAVGAPQRMGKRLGVPAPGCEVSRICPLRLVLMAVSRPCRVSTRLKMQKGPSPTPAERKGLQRVLILGWKRRGCKGLDARGPHVSLILRDFL